MIISRLPKINPYILIIILAVSLASVFVYLGYEGIVGFNIGFARGYTVSGYVYKDFNTTTCCGGVKDSGEPGFAGETVYLRNTADTITYKTAVTNSSGFYRFSNVSAGNDYRVKHSVSAGYTRTTDDSVPFSLPTPKEKGGDGLKHNFGLYQTSSVATPTPTTSAPVTSACSVKSVKKIADGSQAKLSKVNDWIVFSKKINGILQVHKMKTDGSNLQCLTCGKTIPGAKSNGHRGQPAWHPSGNYIIFLANNEHSRPLLRFTDFPGIATNVDVYIMTADGNSYWKITDYAASWGALYPVFSHNGQKITWSEDNSCSRTSCPVQDPDGGCCVFKSDVKNRAPGEELGLWQIMTSNLSFNGSTPVWDTPVGITVNYEGKRVLEGAGFTGDDNGLVFESADINLSNNHAICADVYKSDLSGNYSSFVKLSNSPLSHEENTDYSPSGRKIAYTSGPAVGITYKTDLYIANADGTGETRLTHFIDPSVPCSQGTYVNCYDQYMDIVGDPTWSSDGRKILFWAWNGVEANADDSKYSENLCDGQNWQNALDKAYYEALHMPKWEGNIYMLEFEGACGT